MSFELHRAAKKGDLISVKSLINQKAEVDKPDEQGNTPLYEAAREGHKDIAELLIEHGADVNKSGEHSFTPLCMAVVGGRKDIAELLIEHGADVNKSDERGITPLAIAAAGGYKDIAALLIGHNADVNKHKYGITPLYLAVFFCHKDIVKDIVKLLIEQRDTVINKLGECGITPLCAAVWRGHMDVVELLIRYGADVNLADKQGFTPLDRAVECNHIAIAKLLIFNIFLKNLAEEKPAAIQKNKELSDYWQETLALKKSTFGKIALLDFYSEVDINKLADMACNEEASALINQDGFIKAFPHFGEKIKENLITGSKRKKSLNTSLNSVYFNNKNKALPAECWEIILKYLDTTNLKNVTKVASLSFKSIPSQPSINEKLKLVIKKFKSYQEKLRNEKVSIWDRLTNYFFKDTMSKKLASVSQVISLLEDKPADLTKLAHDLGNLFSQSSFTKYRGFSFFNLRKPTSVQLGEETLAILEKVTPSDHEKSEWSEMLHRAF
jgi:ankyrin repeat protein